METPCIRFQGYIDNKGYGVLYLDGQRVGAHRAAYHVFVGSVPQGLEIDHLCRNRSCVNAEHLEPVTRGVNVLRGQGQGAINKRKTRCLRGHLLHGANLYVNGRGRQCRECSHMRGRQARLENR